MLGWVECVIYALLVCLLGLPALMIVHELGHALVALLITDERVVVRLGRPPARFRLAWQRLEFQVRPFDGSGFYQIEEWQHTSARQRAWAAMGGPAASLLVLLLAGGLAGLAHGTFGGLFLLSFGMAVLALLQVLITLLPIRYPPWWGDYGGMMSDGYRFIYLWRGRHLAM